MATKRDFYWIVSAIAVMATWLFWAVRLQQSAQIFISEVSFSNNEKQDWVEIYNPTLKNLSLKHYYLSDDADDPTRYQISYELVVFSHGVVTLFCKNAKGIPAGAFRLPFNLAEGETLGLSAPDGYLLDKLHLVAPQNFQGAFTLGRPSTDKNNVNVFYSTTPRQVNWEG